MQPKQGLSLQVLIIRVLNVWLCINILVYCFAVKAFIEMVWWSIVSLYIPGVKCFLSERISQDPLEKFFGNQRQRGGVNENPNVKEFCQNTQALRVINTVCRDVRATAAGTNGFEKLMVFRRTHHSRREWLTGRSSSYDSHYMYMYNHVYLQLYVHTHQYHVFH